MKWHLSSVLTVVVGGRVLALQWHKFKLNPPAHFSILTEGSPFRCRPSSFLVFCCCCSCLVTANSSSPRGITWIFSRSAHIYSLLPDYGSSTIFITSQPASWLEKTILKKTKRDISAVKVFKTIYHRLHWISDFRFHAGTIVVCLSICFLVHEVQSFVPNTLVEGT